MSETASVALCQQDPLVLLPEQRGPGAEQNSILEFCSKMIRLPLRAAIHRKGET